VLLGETVGEPDGFTGPIPLLITTLDVLAVSQLNKAVPAGVIVPGFT